jgi:hypothetical protein
VSHIIPTPKLIPLTAPKIVSVLARFESSTNGTLVSNSILNNGTSGTGFTWSCTPASPLKTSVSTAAECKVNDFVASGFAYGTDALNTRGIATLMNAPGVADYVQCTIPDSDYASFGFAFKIGGGFVGSTTEAFTIANMFGASASFQGPVLQDIDPLVMYLDSSGGTSGSVTLDDSTWYWCALEWQKNLLGMGTLIRLSDRLTIARFFGTGMGTEKCSGIRLGRCNTAPGTVADSVFFDDLVINYTDAGPLGPLLPKIF